MFTVGILNVIEQIGFVTALVILEYPSTILTLAKPHFLYQN